MSKYFGDTQRILIEDIITYALVIIFDIVFDFIFNLAIATGMIQSTTGLHPYHFGTFQAIVLCLSALQLIRRVYWWRFYS